MKPPQSSTAQRRAVKKARFSSSAAAHRKISFFKPNRRSRKCLGLMRKVMITICSLRTRAWTRGDSPEQLPQRPSHGVKWILSGSRSEEHTSELQSRLHLVCRLLLDKKRQG